LYPEITRDIQKSSQKLIRSKTLKILTPIKSDSITLMKTFSLFNGEVSSSTLVEGLTTHNKINKT